MRYSALLAATLIVAGCDGELTGDDIPLCTSATAYTIGATVTGTVDSKDCKDVEGNVGDVYQFTTGQTAFVVNFSGTGFKPSIVLYQGTISSASSSRVVADVGASDASSFEAHLPEGAYYFIVTSENATGGNYNFSTSTAVPQQGCGSLRYTTQGMTASGTITANDCAGANTTRFDAYHFYLRSGQTVNITGSLSKSGGFSLRTGDASSPDLVTRLINVSTGGSVSFSYTAPSSALYRVHVGSDPQFTGTTSYVVGIN